MRRIICLISVCMLMCGCAAADKPSVEMCSPKPPELSLISYTSSNESVEEDRYEPLVFGEQRAVWVTYFELAEMFAEESSEEELRRDSDRLFARLEELGFNTVYLHVRAFGDAFYRSRLFAPTKYLAFDCDPLAVMLETAHSHGLAVHAWINPLRCENEENMYRSEGTLIYEWYDNTDSCPCYIVRPDNDEHYWLNPAVPEVRQLVADGVTELCENYDIDGVHIDDYFYPTTDESFDSPQYLADSRGMTLDEWRRENCTLLVKGIYYAVKAADPALPFGVSPQGNNDNNLRFLYADPESWCAEGGCLDYIVPQIYFGYDNAVCPFAETLAGWERIAGDKTLVCGIGMYKAAEGGELSGGEYSGIIASQIRDALSSPSCSGFAVYSASSLLSETDPALIAERALAAAAMRGELAAQ